MKYKIIKLREKDSHSLVTEANFEIAAARADGAELIRLETSDFSGDNVKSLNSLIKLMRSMKETRKIQFFATADSFNSNATEAVFLTNKYPDIFADIPSEYTDYIYVKL